MEEKPEDKKKKKKKPIEEFEIKSQTISESEANQSQKPKDSTIAGFDDLLLGKKKKKKKKRSTETETSQDQNITELWTDINRDYTYTELLTRAKDLLRQRNPDMDPVVCPAPEVIRISVKRTSFANFYRVCKALHRQPEHLQAFLMSELGSSASLEQSLIIKGRFNQKQIETVMRRYIKEYVTCHSCRSPNTILTKEDRIHNLSCEICQATCSVAPIQKTVSASTKK